MRSDVTVAAVNHPRYSHRVRFPGPNGKEVQSWFKNETDALEFAKKRREEIGREGERFGTITEDERAVLAYWRTFAKGSTDAPPAPLLEVVTDYAKRWKATRTSVTVQEAFDRFIATKAGEGLKKVSVDGLRTRCGRFAGDFATRPICTITTGEISDWVLGLDDRRKPVAKGKNRAQVSLLTKKNYRRDVATLFAFAEGRGWVETNPVTKAAKVRAPRKRPGILSAEDTARFLEAVEAVASKLIPFWSLRFFAGIREQEVLRMEWSMVDLEAGEIHLPETITKTGHDRTMKIEPVLDAFLRPHVRPCGRITEASEMSRRYALGKVLKVLHAGDELERSKGRKCPKFTLPKNAARHSYATYHLLKFRHAGETAMQLGHGGSPDMLHRHYKGISTEKEAKAFWSIRPAVPANVINHHGRKSA